MHIRTAHRQYAIIVQLFWLVVTQVHTHWSPRPEDPKVWRRTGDELKTNRWCPYFSLPPLVRALRPNHSLLLLLVCQWQSENIMHAHASPRRRVHSTASIQLAWDATPLQSAFQLSQVIMHRLSETATTFWISIQNSQTSCISNGRKIDCRLCDSRVTSLSMLQLWFLTVSWSTEVLCFSHVVLAGLLSWVDK
jgi:hypothetical protein